jgi:hypothetical protein
MLEVSAPMVSGMYDAPTTFIMSSKALSFVGYTVRVKKSCQFRVRRMRSLPALPSRGRVRGSTVPVRRLSPSNLKGQHRYLEPLSSIHTLSKRAHDRLIYLCSCATDPALRFRSLITAVLRNGACRTSGGIGHCGSDS